MSWRWWLCWRQRRREFDDLFSAIPLKAFGRSLEIGGGDGLFASLLAPKCHLLISTDRYPRDRAEGATPVPCLTCDATQLPFADKSLDVIVSSNVLAHIRNRSDAYRGWVAACDKTAF
jgi:ubiquinone/menaquinone biosynthesis C-methylase UbiE